MTILETIGLFYMILAATIGTVVWLACAYCGARTIAHWIRLGREPKTPSGRVLEPIR